MEEKGAERELVDVMDWLGDSFLGLIFPIFISIFIVAFFSFRLLKLFTFHFLFMFNV